MMNAKRSLILVVALLAFLPSAQAALQDRMAQNCEAEIESVEARIAAARKKASFRTEQGRQSLSSADRWLNQARRHAAKGESRNCVTAAKKGREHLSSR
jgi:hypothetical protein